MASPITWQNVNGPSLADASAPMLAAQRSFDNAFGRVREELDRRQLTEDKNYEVGKENNTQEFISELSKFKTPEELQAAQDSGQFDTMRSRFGAQVNRSAINQAQELRPGLLQERVTRGNQFTDAQQEREFRPTADLLNQAIVSGDSFTFNKLMGDNPNMRDKAKFEQAFSAANSKRTQESRATQTFNNAQTTFDNQQAMAPVAMEQARANLASTKAQTAVRNAEAQDKAGQSVGSNIVRAAQSNFVGRQNNRINSFMEIGNALGLPVDPAGLPDLKALDEQQFKDFQNAVKTGGFDVPVANATVALNKAREAAIAAGLNPKQQLEAEDQLRKLIVSPPLSPEDAKKQEEAESDFDAKIKERRASNVYISTPKEILADKEAVYSTLTTKVKDSPGTIQNLVNEARELMEVGIDIKGKKVPIPPKLLKSFMAQTLEADEFMFGVNESISDTIPLLRKFMDSDEAQEMRNDVQYFANGGDREDRKNLKAAFAAGTGTNNPNSFLDAFTKEVERRQKQGNGN